MAFFKPVPRELQTLFETVSLESNESVLGTTRGKTTTRGEKGRDAQLVKPDKQNGHTRGDAHLLFLVLVHGVIEFQLSQAIFQDGSRALKTEHLECPCVLRTLRRIRETGRLLLGTLLAYGASPCYAKLHCLVFSLL